MSSHNLLKFTALISLSLLLLSASVSAKVEVGQSPYDYLGKNSDGNKIHASDYKGKVVIISFWATWCPPCMKELPVLSGIQKVAGTDRVQVIAVNYQESKSRFRDVSAALADNPMIFTHDLKGRLGDRFGVKGIPHMVLVGRDGLVKAINVGYDDSKLPELAQQIDQLIAESYE